MVQIRYGDGTTEYGPGVTIEMSGEEVARAIEAFLVANDVHIRGARTIRVNGDLCDAGSVYVDPGAFVVVKGVHFSGRGPDAKQ